MQIGQDKVVTIAYTLKDDAGQVIDTSEGGEPLAYLHGAQNIVPGLEKALEGKSVGDSFNVSVSPEEGYGRRDDSLVQNIPLRKLPEKKVQPGMRFRVMTDVGPRILTVISVSGDYAKVDANHPLADKTLHFDIKVVDVRDATDEEKTHGHVHGPHGHDH